MKPATKRLVKAGVILFDLVVIAAVLAFAYKRLHKPGGQDLNAEAWQASYAERRLPLPKDGPRDGYWGRRLPRLVRDAKIGWREAEAHLMPFAETDEAGMQVVPAPVGVRACHVLIVGGSVAWGAYASLAEHTYFHRLALALAAAGQPVRITVLAAGAWDSENELLAVKARGPKVSPDLIVVLDGLNDLTDSGCRHRRKLGKQAIPIDQRVDRYLANMRLLRDLAFQRRLPIVFVLQPSPLSKQHKTPLEQRVIELSDVTEEFMRDGYERMRAGLAALSRTPGASFIDASGAFDRESATTFADLYHFSDPGHALLAEHLTPALVRVLASSPRQVRAAATGTAP